MMRKAALILASAAILLSLTGCDASRQYEEREEREERMYKLCIENGGDWFTSNANNEVSCTIPKEKP